MTPYGLERLGERAVLVRYGRCVDASAYDGVMRLDAMLRRRPFPGFVEAVPSYAALAVHYDPWIVYRRSGRGARLPFDIVSDLLRELLLSQESAGGGETRIVTIPVCYGGAYGPDLEDLADQRGLSEPEVVRLHSEAEYQVYMLGFMPGFPYMGGLPAVLATPRRSTPRLVVPAGSVGIAGGQTGVYPLQSPGGWQLIGRTPLRLFLPERDPPTLLRAGDRIRFRPIGAEEYEASALGEQQVMGKLGLADR
ncbi:5-oxoprolinase subunit PxpB [Paenibacillus koleovorans]|uniref:5-oxoprolinase subunit PxpB n=1 Tax=Paenibacillus koleovorans TaxID=121608 RepID=UPI000FD8F32A|nr:5-oxoprolinase subunit PxpB [Paenibacillus koleovorans]